jgi:hypothetical protein
MPDCQAQFGKGVPFPQQRAPIPARAIRLSSMAREGGVLRYSTTCGSIPALRIMASALRDVPQAGL